MTDWTDLTARAAFASHRLVGWIYWDPRAIERFGTLGAPEFAYYINSRGAPLLPAGHQALAAAYYSINPMFVQLSVEAAIEHTTASDIYDERNAAVGEGLRLYVPEIEDDLASLARELWAAADTLSSSGRVLFAAHRQMPRPDDALVSAWLAVNCIREWRGDTHFAILAAEDLSGTQAGILHDAHLNYGGWIAGSRGSDDAAIAAGLADLEARGLANGGVVNGTGLALRQEIEDRTNLQSERAWRALGAEATERYLALVEPVGQRLLDRIDETAGPNWMPAARERRP